MIDGCRKQIATEDADRIADILCTQETDRAPLLDLLLNTPDLRDDVLDDPKLIGAMMEITDKSMMSPRLYFYIGLRHYLCKQGLNDRDLADYLCTMCVHFLYQTPWAPSNPMMCPGAYVDRVIDILSQETAKENWTQVWCLHSHLGHYLLFFTGLLPQVIRMAEINSGVPMYTYEEIGKNHFKQASHFEIPAADFYRRLHDHFGVIRSSLSQLSISPFL